MHRLIFPALVMAFALTAVGLTPQPAEAAMYKGWFNFGGTTSKTRTFIDGSPARTPVAILLQKKAGPKPCRAQVTVRSGNYVVRYKPIYKYTRTQSRGFADVIYWPDRTKRTTISVQTNGRCIYHMFAK